MIKSKVSGISLLEVLITILVVAIGMLGMAAMQVKTLSSAQESYSRSQAVALLEDVSARIRANREFIASEAASVVIKDPDDETAEIDIANPYTNNNDSGAFHQWCAIDGNPYEPVSSCVSGACNSQQLAYSDIDSVCQSLFSTGMNKGSFGASCIDRDTTDADKCSSGSKMTLYVAWKQEQREDTGDKVIANTRCQNALPNNMAGDGFSCAIVELIP